MAGDRELFHESMKDLRIKIERYMLKYGNSMGKMDKSDFSEIIGEKPGFRQNEINIARIIAWNVCINSNCPELGEDVIAWAEAIRKYARAASFPAVYKMVIDDMRHLNAMAKIAYGYMQRATPLQQAWFYKTLEDLKIYASDYEASSAYRRQPSEAESTS